MHVFGDENRKGGENLGLCERPRKAMEECVQLHSHVKPPGSLRWEGHLVVKEVQ